MCFIEKEGIICDIQDEHEGDNPDDFTNTNKGPNEKGAYGILQVIGKSLNDYVYNNQDLHYFDFLNNILTSKDSNGIEYWKYDPFINIGAGMGILFCKYSEICDPNHPSNLASWWEALGNYNGQPDNPNDPDDENVRYRRNLRKFHKRIMGVK